MMYEPRSKPLDKWLDFSTPTLTNRIVDAIGFAVVFIPVLILLAIFSPETLEG